MEIKFDFDKLEFITDWSTYNHSFYKLSYSIDGCDILLVSHDECSCENSYFLGVFDEREDFKEKLGFYEIGEDKIDLTKNKIDIL